MAELAGGPARPAMRPSRPAGEPGSRAAGFALFAQRPSAMVGADCEEGTVTNRWAIVLSLVLGCGSSGPQPGSEKGACYGNKTCNAGLACLSDICVKPQSGGPGPNAAALGPVTYTCLDAARNAARLAFPSDPGADAKAVDMAAECESTGMSQPTIACVAIAKTQDDLSGCLEREHPEQYRKARTTEAVTNVKKLYDGARSYYEEESSARGSITPIAKQFPSTAAVATAPALGACCSMPGKKCIPEPSLWTDPSWQALKFSMDDPHYYSYTYISSGTDATAQFTVRANGDLDCDGVYSTFEMVGSIQSDGTVTGQAGFFKDKDLE